MRNPDLLALPADEGRTFRSTGPLREAWPSFACLRRRVCHFWSPYRLGRRHHRRRKSWRILFRWPLRVKHWVHGNRMFPL